MEINKQIKFIFYITTTHIRLVLRMQLTQIHNQQLNTLNNYMIYH